MKIVIEFYRTRNADDAPCRRRSRTVEVDDLDGAIAVAAVGADPRHAATPDRMTIIGADGKLHYCGIVGPEAVSEGRQ